MRAESLVLQYRQLQKQEEKKLRETRRPLLAPALNRLNGVIQDQIQLDLLHEITQAVEPVLASYLKQYTPMRRQKALLSQVYGALGITDVQALDALRVGQIDQYASAVIRKNGLIVSATGSVGAVGGIAVGLMELSVLMGKAMETMEHICTAYGYDAENYFEKVYRLMLIPFSLVPDPEHRRLVYGRLCLVENWLSQSDIPLGKREEYYPPQEAAAFCAGHIAEALSENRLLQAAPLAGALLGATMNYSFVSQIGHQAQHLYKRRYLARRLAL